MKVLIATAIYPTRENPAFGSFVKTQVDALLQAGVEIDLFVLQGRNRKLMYPLSVFKLRQRLRADRSIDLVHAHYSYVGLVGRMQRQAPLVVTYHGSDILGSPRENGQPSPSDPLVIKMGQWLGRHADAVIVQSREMAAQFDRAIVHILPHEVDLDLFRPLDRAEARSALGLASDKKYLLFAANPQIAVKRYPLAKDVADYLRQRDPAIELIVVYKEPQPRLVQYMNACDALLFTSFQEGSPNIVKQALACNLPLVSTDVGDVREMVGDATLSYLCAPDVTQFAEKVGEILRVGGRSNGRQKVLHLARPLVAQRLVAVYQEVLQRSAARAKVSLTPDAK